MNNSKLLIETKTIVTKWAVPQDAALEDLNTRILFYSLDQVYEDGQVLDAPKVHVEFKKTLEIEELSDEEQQELQAYPEQNELDTVIGVIEEVLIQTKPPTGLDLINAYEQLELLKNWITMRMATLVE